LKSYRKSILTIYPRRTQIISAKIQAMKQFKYLFFLPISLVLIFLSCGPATVNVYTSGNWIYNSNGIPGANRSSAVSFVVGNKVYIGTGYNHTLVANRLADFYSFDPTVGGFQGTWSQISTPPPAFTPRSNAVAFAVGTNGYVTLGQDINSTFLLDTWQYDTEKNTWSPKANFGSGDIRATPRIDATAFAIGNYGYVVCGADNLGSNKKDSWVYDQISDNWSLTPVQFNGSKRSGAIAFVRGDSVAYVVTGTDGGVPAIDMIKFNPKNTIEPWKTMKNIYPTSTDPYDDDYSDIERDHGVGFTLGDSAYITLGSNGGNIKCWGYDFKNDLWFRKTSFEIRGATTGRSNAVGFTVAGRSFISTGVSGSGELGDLVEWLPYEIYNAND
jgi:N-acetylneuraminic acid mutarotase